MAFKFSYRIIIKLEVPKDLFLLAKIARFAECWTIFVVELSAQLSGNVFDSVVDSHIKHRHIYPSQGFCIEIY